MTRPKIEALPVPLTSLVERTDESCQLRVLLADPSVRLVTLHGPAGIGKTRLALALAKEFANDIADSAVFVDLAAIANPEVVPHAIASVL